jgi:hypothetical protein
MNYYNWAVSNEVPKVKKAHWGSALSIASNLIAISVVFNQKIMRGWNLHVLHTQVPGMPCLLLVVVAMGCSIVWNMCSIFLPNRLMPYFPPHITDHWILGGTVIGLITAVYCIMIDMNELFSLLTVVLAVELIVYRFYWNEKHSKPIWFKVKQTWFFYIYILATTLVYVIEERQESVLFITMKWTMFVLPHVTLLSLAMAADSLHLRREHWFVMSITLYQFISLWLLALQ